MYLFAVSCHNSECHNFLTNVCSLFRKSGKDWQLSGNLTPMAGAVHACYYQKVNDNVHISAELEGSLRTQEVVTMIGYQIDLPSANVSFRGMFMFILRMCVCHYSREHCQNAIICYVN